ncbi:MAG: hypothetical protein RSD81_06060 [Pseudomonas sp.]
MRDLMEHLFEIKDLADGLNKLASEKYRIPSEHMPIAAFNMTSNRITLALEVMEYYCSVFPRPEEGRLEDQTKKYKNESERLVETLNSCFVSMMSVMESCARKASYYVRDVMGPPSGTLFNLIEKSRSIGWISKSDEALWKNLIGVRNALVHNNGEFKEFGEFQLPGGIVWRFRPGVQSQTTLRHIPACLRWAISSYAVWCIKLLDVWDEKFDYKPAWNRFYSYEVSADTLIPLWGVDGWSNKGAWCW